MRFNSTASDQTYGELVIAAKGDYSLVDKAMMQAYEASSLTGQPYTVETVKGIITNLVR